MLDVEIRKHAYSEKIFINGEEAWPLHDSYESPTGESGRSRLVYMTSTHVFKKGGIGEAFLNIDEEDQKHFAKVTLVDIKRNWLVMERLNCKPTMCTAEQYEVVRNLCEKYNIYDVSWTDGVWGVDGMTRSDIPDSDEEYSEDFGHPRNTHNWIVDNNGVPVIFDYEQHTGKWEDQGCYYK